MAVDQVWEMLLAARRMRILAMHRLLQVIIKNIQI
jgi:hypothetical protein